MSEPTFPQEQDSHIMKNGYLWGIFWVILSALTSSLNDVLVKYVGQRLDPSQVSFCRFFLGTLVLLPVIFLKGTVSFKTKYLFIHGVRSMLLWVAMSVWCFGVVSLPLTLATTLSFTTPLFVLLLAAIFLKERIGWQRALASIIGFIGVVISTMPSGIGGWSLSSFSGWNITALFLLASTIFFASLDVMNKKLLTEDEGLFSMLFYSALGTTLLSVPFAVLNWKTPDLSEFFFLTLLGGGSNLILFFLLKAFSACDVSSLQPVRYIELLFSGVMGWIVFQQLPTSQTLVGAGLIIPATFFVVWYETRKKEIYKDSKRRISPA